MPRGKSAQETRDLVYWFFDRNRTSSVPAANIAVNIRCPRTSTENACRQLYQQGKIERKKVKRVYFYRWKMPSESGEPVVINESPEGWWFRLGKQKRWHGVYEDYEEAMVAAADCCPSSVSTIEFKQFTCAATEVL